MTFSGLLVYGLTESAHSSKSVDCSRLYYSCSVYSTVISNLQFALPNYPFV